MASKKKPKSRISHRDRIWEFKNTILLVVSLIVFFFLAQTSAVTNFIDHVGSLGYVGAFITGIFFVSTYTAVPATFILFNLADQLHPIPVALFAGLGAMVGDYLIYRLVKDHLFEELRPVFSKFNHPAVSNLFKTPYFAWLLPVLGAVIIASPLPDEVGVSLLGLSKIRKWQFFAVTYILNVVGIFIIVSVARL